MLSVKKAGRCIEFSVIKLLTIVTGLVMQYQDPSE